MEKRILAILLAFTLAFSMATTAFADGRDTTPQVGDVVGTGTIAGAEVTYLPLSAIVPNSADMLDFVIDPLGLLDLPVGHVLPDLSPSTNAVSFDNSPIVGVFNTSSIDVLLSVDLSVAADGVRVVVDEDELQTTDDDTEASILFWVELNVDDITDTTDVTTDDFVGFAQVIAFGVGGSTDDDVTLCFVLPGLPSEFRVTAVDSPTVYLSETLEYSDDFVGTAFKFGGVFNENANWDDAEISIQAVFTVEAYYVGATGVVAHPTIFGLLTAGTNVDGAGAVVVAPVFIDRPAGFGGEVALTAGFIVGDGFVAELTMDGLTPRQWIIVPFYGGGLYIESMYYQAIWPMVDGTSFGYVPGSGNLYIELGGATTATGSDILITMTDGTEYTLTVITAQ